MVEIHSLTNVLYYLHPKYALSHVHLKISHIPFMITSNNINIPADAIYDPLGEYFAHCTVVECSVYTSHCDESYRASLSSSNRILQFQYALTSILRMKTLLPLVYKNVFPFGSAPKTIGCPRVVRGNEA